MVAFGGRCTYDSTMFFTTTNSAPLQSPPTPPAHLYANPPPHRMTLKYKSPANNLSTKDRLIFSIFEVVFTVIVDGDPQ